MPSPVTTAPAPSTAGGTAQTTQVAQQSQQSALVVPFVRASAEHTEQVSDVSLAMTAAVQNLNNLAIPAYGYVRAIVIQVTTTLAAGAATFAADGPWNALQNIMLTEPNGAIISQYNSGYDLYLANKWGGYRGFNDPEQKGYTASAANGNFTFFLRIPVELNARDALGSLPNQNSAAAFQVRMQLNASTSVYSAVPATTLPTVRIRAWAEEWDQPALSSGGASNQTTPPAMNTTQFWTPQVFSVGAAGQQTIRLTRVGNYIRMLIFKFEAATRALGETNWPDQITVMLDSRPLTILQKDVWRAMLYERTGYSSSTATTALDAVGGQDSGVFVLDFAHEFDGKIGYENRDLWLPTLGSTRLEVQGNFTAAGTFTVLTNDVTVAGNVFM